MEHCDTLLMLGTDFPYRQFYPPAGVPVIQVDLSAASTWGDAGLSMYPWSGR